MKGEGLSVFGIDSIIKENLSF